MSAYVIVFDLDGTIANCEHRVHHIQKENPDWDAFFDGCDKDEPISAGAVIYNLLVTQSLMLGKAIKEGNVEADVPLVDIVTGRPERLRGRTIAWLALTGLLMPRAIHMRRDGDHRPDDVVKMEIYEQQYRGREEVLAVFEDRARVVKAWRGAGVPCYQVAEGNF